MIQNNKKLPVFFAAFLLLLCVAAAMGSTQASAKKKTFTVGFDAEFPPYGYKAENGEYIGFDLDLAQEVCNRRGWKLVKQPIDWDSKDMELNSNTIDCIWNGFTMNGREDKYTFSNPYVDNSQVVLVNGNSEITSLNDLAGKVVVVQADSAALAALDGDDATEENKLLAESFAELQQVGDYNSAIMNLEAGAVDAVCMDIGVAKYQQNKHKGLIILEEKISSEEYGIGFKLGNTKLRDEVQETLYEMLDDGTFDEIAQKYSDFNLPACVCLGQERVSEEGTKTVKETPQVELVESGLKNSEEKQGGFFKECRQIVVQLAEGMKATLTIFFFTLLFSMPLGLLVAFGRMSRFAPLRYIMKAYIAVLRGTPLMLQLLVVFFGPYYVFGVPLGKLGSNYRLIAVLIGFSLNYAAYFAEIYRSGIESIPTGQREAAKLLGYTKRQTFVKIIFPQMVKRVLPPVTNEIITLVKDTSLAFVLAYTEMFTLAKQISSRLTNVMPLFLAGVFYFVFNYLVAFVMERIEKKMNYYQ